jgi:carbohydrate-binding DOMON domain-containing protein
MDLIVALGDLDDFGSVPIWPGSPAAVEWRLGGPDAVGLTSQRRGSFVDLFGEIRTRVDALLLDLPGVSQMRIPEVA